MNPNNPSQPTEQPTPPVETQSVAPKALRFPDLKNMNRKKLITVASIAGGALVLAIIATILYVSLMTVSKQDYRDAVVQYNAVSGAGSKLTSSIKAFSSSTMSGSDEAYDSAVKTAEGSITSIQEENTKLAELKAVRIGEGKELYTAFNNKLTTYLAYGDDVIGSIEKVRPALVTCAGISKASTSDAQLAAVKSCSTTLNSVNDVPNAEFSTFINSLKGGYTKYITVYEGMSALTSPFGSQYDQYKSLRDQMNAIQKDIQAASKTFSTDIAKHDSDVSVKASADALGNYLSKQQK